MFLLAIHLPPVAPRLAPTSPRDVQQESLLIKNAPNEVNVIKIRRPNKALKRLVKQ